MIDASRACAEVMCAVMLMILQEGAIFSVAWRVDRPMASVISAILQIPIETHLGIVSRSSLAVAIVPRTPCALAALAKTALAAIVPDNLPRVLRVKEGTVIAMCA